ncbi:glycosyltransferase [Namhaeicola litoreus]|uniref:Glycosyltransferase n=1 Tax=Namhaeicola litoreus TaxID=1052145 RepID=A0ABW3Y731_9FLAO
MKLNSNSYQPLVSIVVVTYNSSRFILETLESAKKQTYKNIELVITDDCSPDNTVEICKDWLKNNDHNFIRAKILANNTNVGVSGNCNKGLREARGDWVKFIAGDDLLMENAIEDVVKFINNNPESKVVFGNILKIMNGQIQPRHRKKINFCKESRQKEMAYKGYLPFAPSLFLETDFIKKIDGFNENYPFMEDYPLFLKIVNRGVPFHFLEKPVVLYRIHDQNISSNIRFIKDYENFVFKEILPFLKKNRYWMSYLHFYNLIYVRRLNMKLKDGNPLASKLLRHLVLRNLLENISRKLKL